MKRELEKINAERSVAAKPKAARKERTRAAAALSKLHAVHALGETRTSDAIQQNLPQLMSHSGSHNVTTKHAPSDNLKRGRKTAGKIKGLTKMTAMNFVVQAAAENQDQKGHATAVRVGDTKTTATTKLGKIKGLAKMHARTLGHAAIIQEVSQEDPAAPDLGRKHSDPLFRPIPQPAGCLLADDFSDFIRDHVEALNRFDRRPYQIERSGPAFSCKAHLRHRIGHFSFGLLARLGAKKKSLEAT